ncbi:MAG: ZIP family metal transporter [Rickettsiales bacterium]|nr:ZIP family metal transporter [Rickettsiales bacterium]
MVAVILSSIILKIFTINSTTKSVIQHFSAGVVFAALSVELIPELYKTSFELHLIIGFVIGAALMLFIRKIFNNKEGGRKSIATLLTAVGIDIFIDGFLVGVTFAISIAKGLIISLALSLELLFLVLSVDVSLQKIGKKFSSIICINLGFALLVMLGSAIGLTFINASKGTMVGITSFAAAALLYLVTEELLKEAHEEEEASVSTALFFLGFLIVLLLK